MRWQRKLKNLSENKKIAIEFCEDLVVIWSVENDTLNKGSNKLALKNAGFAYSEQTLRFEVAKDQLDSNRLKFILKSFKKKGYIIEDKTGLVDEIISQEQTENDLMNQLKYAREIKRNPTNVPLYLKEFKRTLLPFQENIVKHHIVAKNAANFSVPGAGKSTMILATYSYHKYHTKEVTSLFVLCPINAFNTWVEEFEACFGYSPKIAILNGPNRKQFYNSSETYDMYIANHATLTNDISEIIGLLSKTPCMLVVDESHYIKNFSPNATWANAALEVAPAAKIRFIATGTPAPNNEKDFWSQITFLLGSNSLLGNRSSYMTKLEMSTQRREVMDIIRSISHRVTKQDLNLPPVTHQVVEVEMEPIQKELYETLSLKMLEDLPEMSKSDMQYFIIWKRHSLIRLRQISSNPLLLKKTYEESFGEGELINKLMSYEKFETSSKFKKTVKIALDHARNGERVIIWSDFVQNIKLLRKFFLNKGIKTFHVCGELPKESSDEAVDIITRDSEINSFKENEGSILIANPHTLAESVSLHHHCHVAIYMDWSFNAVHMMQSRDRIHRVGLDPNILTKYYYIQNKDSIDEVMISRLAEKENLMNQILQNEIPVATGEFNGEVLDEEQDFEVVLTHIKKLVGDTSSEI